jgi:hypothetical protein
VRSGGREKGPISPLKRNSPLFRSNLSSATPNPPVMAPSSATAGLALAALVSRECRRANASGVSARPPPHLRVFSPSSSKARRAAIPRPRRPHAARFDGRQIRPRPIVGVGGPWPPPYPRSQLLRLPPPSFSAQSLPDRGSGRAAPRPSPLRAAAMRSRRSTRVPSSPSAGAATTTPSRAFRSATTPVSLSPTQRNGVEVRPSSRYPTAQRPPWRPLPATYWRSWPYNHYCRARDAAKPCYSGAKPCYYQTLTSHTFPLNTPPLPLSPPPFLPPISLPPVRRDAHEPRL